MGGSTSVMAFAAKISKPHARPYSTVNEKRRTIAELAGDRIAHRDQRVCEVPFSFGNADGSSNRETRGPSARGVPAAVEAYAPSKANSNASPSAPNVLQGFLAGSLHDYPEYEKCFELRYDTRPKVCSLKLIKS